MQQKLKTLNSSAGFKTLKLRQSGSLRPQSSSMSIMDYGLIPYELSEQAFQSQLKADIIQVEQEIQRITLDVTMHKQQLCAQHIQKIRQWISQPHLTQHTNDIQHIMQICKCNDAEETAVKLFNMIQSLDQYVNKVTELQCLHFLKYEQICDTQQSARIQQIAQQGVIPNRLLISLANMDRIQELAYKSSRNKQDLPSLSQSTIEQSISIDNSKQIIKLEQQIEQQRKNENKLQQDYLGLLKEYKKLQQSQQVIPPTVAPQPNNLLKLIDEVKDNYQSMLHSLRSENQSLHLRVSDLQVQVEIDRVELAEQHKKIEQLSKIKDDLYVRFSSKYKSTEQYEESYEAALKEEYAKMQESYESRVQRLQNELEESKKEYNKKYSEIKGVLDKTSDNERLLTKKLSIFTVKM